MTEDNVPASGSPVLPYTPSPELKVTEWSEAIYTELKDWLPTSQARWEWWPPGYLVLRIVRFLDQPIEPIIIDTCDDVLSIEFGHWDTTLPEDGDHYDFDPCREAKTAQTAKTVALDWLHGRIATAVYLNSQGKWCGSKLLERPEDYSALADIDWIAFNNPTQVEIRTSVRSDWLKYQIIDGRLQSMPTRADSGKPNRDIP